MTTLVDSDIVIDHLRGQREARRFLAARLPHGLCICIIRYGEIYEGIYSGREAEHHELGFLAFLQDVTVEPLTLTIMREFARLRADLRAAGMLIPDPDLLIAATALDRGMPLATRNVRHFGRIPGLRLETL